MIETIQPERLPTPGGHYSHAVAANGLLFISGQLPIDHEGSPLSGQAFEKQVNQVLINIDAILANEGLTKERLVQVRVYVTDIATWPTFNAMYADWIGAHRPARAVVPVPELHYGLALEIEAVAAF